MPGVCSLRLLGCEDVRSAHPGCLENRWALGGTGGLWGLGNRWVLRTSQQVGPGDWETDGPDGGQVGSGGGAQWASSLRRGVSLPHPGRAAEGAGLLSERLPSPTLLLCQAWTVGPRGRRPGCPGCRAARAQAPHVSRSPAGQPRHHLGHPLLPPAGESGPPPQPPWQPESQPQLLGRAQRESQRVEQRLVLRTRSCPLCQALAAAASRQGGLTD